MPDLKEKIKEVLKEALKRNDQNTLSTLRMLLAAILNKEIAAKKEKGLSDDEIIEIIFSEIRKRKEAVLSYEQGKREDLADKEKKEMEVLQKYLPEQIPEDEIKKIAKEVIDKVIGKEIHPVKSAEGGVPPKAEQFNRARDMGKVMAEVMPKVKGRADNSLVSKIVKDLLTAK